LPKGTNILPLKEVFKIKVDEHGQIKEFKARFTPKGFRQKPGVTVDFNETFARTAMYKTERLALALCALLDNELYQFDVLTAFLNADMHMVAIEEVYVELPKGFCAEGKVARLLKSLYGCKQSRCVRGSPPTPLASATRHSQLELINCIAVGLRL
jgi:hypothetical protein